VIRIGKSVFFYFDSGLNENYILIGLLACAAIGPMTLYFVRSQLSGDKTFDPKSLLHLIPMVLLAVYALFFESYNENRALWSGTIVRGIYYYWGVYMLFAVFLVVRESVVRKKAFAEDRWTQGVVLGVTLIWLAYLTSSFTSYLTGALTFSFAVYLLAWIIITSTRKKDSTKQKTRLSAGMTPTEVEELRVKIRKVLMQDHRYKSPDLTMPAVAKLVGQTPHQFSSFINEQLNQNFPQLINAYRIEAAREMLCTEDHLTVEAIGFDCGFNSPSTFHTAFKKATGKTPAAYRKMKTKTAGL
jgi:AraC-like DNA-binding protein